MCLIINENYHKNFKPLKAEREFAVWKIVCCGFKPVIFISNIYCFRYEKGFEYFITNKRPFSYRTKSELHSRASFKYKVVDRGFHSYKTRPNLKTSARFQKIVKFYIPKGSLYFIGTEGDIVSNRIILY